jgi:redox-sensitive bicupin YhaK (pirin superfamily)
MSVTNLLKGHEKDLGGGLMVRRFLPSAVKQAVGPFIFFDHFGPVDVPLDADHDVRWITATAWVPSSASSRAPSTG